jgi:hypothetical protein
MLIVLAAEPFLYSAKHSCGVCLAMTAEGLLCESFPGSCASLNTSFLELHHNDCVRAGACAPLAPRKHTAKSRSRGAGELDIRVAKGFGTKPYNTLRVSVITQDGAPAFDLGTFEYSAPFKYKWTDNTLSSSLVSVPADGKMDFEIGNTTLTLRLPAQGTGVAGVLIADPCIKDASITSYVGCEYGALNS